MVSYHSYWKQTDDFVRWGSDLISTSLDSGGHISDKRPPIWVIGKEGRSPGGALIMDEERANKGGRRERAEREMSSCSTNCTF